MLRRKAANRFRTELRRGDREHLAARSEASEDSAHSVEQMEVVERLFRLVRELEEPQREAVLGRLYRGLSYVELGQELGAPPSTVQSRVQRGLETLRVQLEPTSVEIAASNAADWRTTARGEGSYPWIYPVENSEVWDAPMDAYQAQGPFRWTPSEPLRLNQLSTNASMLRIAIPGTRERVEVDIQPRTFSRVEAEIPIPEL